MNANLAIFIGMFNRFSTAVMVLLWLAGVVLANGFWSTACSIFFAPYAWYLVVEKAMTMGGLIP